MKLFSLLFEEVWMNYEPVELAEAALDTATAIQEQVELYKRTGHGLEDTTLHEVEHWIFGIKYAIEEGLQLLRVSEEQKTQKLSKRYGDLRLDGYKTSLKRFVTAAVGLSGTLGERLLSSKSRFVSSKLVKDLNEQIPELIKSVEQRINDLTRRDEDGIPLPTRPA